MVADPQAPATKQDIQLLMEIISDYFQKTEKRFEEQHAYMDQRFAEQSLHFDFKLETLRHDFIGSTSDAIQGLDTRVARLEKKARFS